MALSKTGRDNCLTISITLPLFSSKSVESIEINSIELPNLKSLDFKFFVLNKVFLARILLY